MKHEKALSPRLLRREALLLAGMLALAGCSTVGITAPDEYPSPAAHETEQTIDYLPHTVVATTYWIGEGETASNDYISNQPSAWSSDAAAEFGGADTLRSRNFTPFHNTFYAALPAMEFDEQGLVKDAYANAPWNPADLEEGESLFKGRWIRVEKDNQTIYVQWHDVGPCSQDQTECLTDYNYVFGDEEPLNTFGQMAGIDLSPDASKALDLDGSAVVTWQFVDEKDVPYGPWKRYPAITNKTNW